MILRKPYAFLIKYFQKINILLLLLIIFVFSKNQQIYQFVKEYLITSSYNPTINSINNYANILVYLAFIIILIITAILIYLLRYKHKPYLSYIFIFVANLITFIFFLYTDNYFTYQILGGYNLITVKIVKDLLLIGTLPYYPMIFILLIRSIGIDLKSFGFQEDKEFASINEEDREEVEVQVGFDKERLIRKIKYYIRHTKYFFLEHKFSLTIISIIMTLLISFNIYHYFYVENRIYAMNESFKSNNYRLKVKNTYLTDKDFAGNIISREGKYFVLVQLEIENLITSTRNFDIEKMLLYIDNDYYVPTTKYNIYFTDMGNLYEDSTISPKGKATYTLIYDINKPKEKSNFILRYQDLTNKDSKLIGVKMKVLDISAFKDKGKKIFPNSMTIPINENENATFKIFTSEFLSSTTYRYLQCLPDTCPIYEQEIKAPNNYKIWYLRGNFGDYSTKEFLSFLEKYGKISYQKDNTVKNIKINYAVTRDYQGNHIYILVPNEVAKADIVDLVFTIRTYQYTYRMKGE